MKPTYAKHAKENLVVSREEKQRGWTNRTTALLRPGVDAAGHPSPPPMVAVTHDILRPRLELITRRSSQGSFRKYRRAASSRRSRDIFTRTNIFRGGSAQNNHARVAPKRFPSLTVAPCMRGMPREHKIRVQSAGLTVSAPIDKLTDQKNVF